MTHFPTKRLVTATVLWPIPFVMLLFFLVMAWTSTDEWGGLAWILGLMILEPPVTLVTSGVGLGMGISALRHERRRVSQARPEDRPGMVGLIWSIIVVCAHALVLLVAIALAILILSIILFGV